MVAKLGDNRLKIVKDAKKIPIIEEGDFFFQKMTLKNTKMLYQKAKE